jgi:predicted  nucleic acid-binding Zn-ribbon protein
MAMFFFDFFKGNKRKIKEQISELKIEREGLEKEFKKHHSKYEELWSKYHSNEMNYTSAMKVDNVCYELKAKIKEIDKKIKELEEEL